QRSLLRVTGQVDDGPGWSLQQCLDAEFAAAFARQLPSCVELVRRGFVDSNGRGGRGDQRNTQRLHGLRTRGCKRRTASTGVGMRSSAEFVGGGAATCGVDATGVSPPLRKGAVLSHSAGARHGPHSRYPGWPAKPEAGRPPGAFVQIVSGRTRTIIQRPCVSGRVARSLNTTRIGGLEHEHDAVPALVGGWL